MADDASPPDEVSRPASGRPAWARWLTRISLVLAIAMLIMTIRDLGVRTLGHYLALIGWWWFAVVPMEIICTTLDATAIRAFASPDKIRLRSTLLAQLSGRAVNAVTPSGNLGEAVKMSVLTDVVTQSRAVSTILLYNIVSFQVELVIIAIAAPLAMVLVAMPTSMHWLMGVTSASCIILTLGLHFLVRRGMLVGAARFARKIRLISPARYDRWEPKCRTIDSNMRLTKDARRRDRWIGVIAVVLSRLNSLALSLLILHAVGKSITLGFVAAWIVGSFAIYFASALTPMGIGVAEGGYYGLFRALGENPARGVTLVLARRTVTIMYAALGLVLVTMSETVKRAKLAQAAKAKAAQQVPASAHGALAVAPAAEPAD